MRSYDQLCSLARALDVVGDRWTMLVVRNLLLGPRRWSELRADLPGIASNLLAERMRQLQEDGLVEHTDEHYRLTEAGAALEGALFALANWGERYRAAPPRPGEAFRLRYLMTSLRRRLRPSPRTATLHLVVGGEAFGVRLGATPTLRALPVDAPVDATDDAAGCADAADDDAGSADASVRTDVATWVDLAFGRRRWRDAADSGTLAHTGDDAVIDAFWASLAPIGSG